MGNYFVCDCFARFHPHAFWCVSRSYHGVSSGLLLCFMVYGQIKYSLITLICECVYSVYVCVCLLQPSGRLVAASKAAVPTVSDPASALQLGNFAKSTAAAVSELRNAASKVWWQCHGCVAFLHGDEIQHVETVTVKWSEVPIETFYWLPLTVFNQSSRQIMVSPKCCAQCVLDSEAFSMVRGVDSRHSNSHWSFLQDLCQSLCSSSLEVHCPPLVSWDFFSFCGQDGEYLTQYSSTSLAGQFVTLHHRLTGTG